MQRTVAAISIVLALCSCEGVERARQEHVDQELDKIHRQVARDAESQYRLAKKSGDKMAICSQAGFVSAAWLQAEDEAKYLSWKKVEKADCEAAGMPSM